MPHQNAKGIELFRFGHQISRQIWDHMPILGKQNWGWRGVGLDSLLEPYRFALAFTHRLFQVILFEHKRMQLHHGFFVGCVPPLVMDSLQKIGVQLGSINHTVNCSALPS